MRNTYAGLIENPNEQFRGKESTKKNFNGIPQNMRLANTIQAYIPSMNPGREEFTKRGDASQFYYNNKNNANETGSYVRSGGQKNEEYMRKTYNFYGDYREKLNVFIRYDLIFTMIFIFCSRLKEIKK